MANMHDIKSQPVVKYALKAKGPAGENRSNSVKVEEESNQLVPGTADFP